MQWQRSLASYQFHRRRVHRSGGYGRRDTRENKDSDDNLRPE